MSVEAATTPEAPPEPASGLDVGDEVWVLYWRPDPYLDGTDRGQWDWADGRVISSGRRVCYEIAGGLPPSLGGDGDAPRGSLLRFALPEDVYATREDADRACRTRKPRSNRPTHTGV